MNSTPKETIIKTNFGKINGEDIHLFTLTNKAGNQVSITNYGGIVTQWISADKNGKMSSIVLGFNELEKYVLDNPHFGALVGRYANRIAKGKFAIGNKEYTLATNNGENHIHGGIHNFSKVTWSAAIDEVSHALVLSYLSKDGEEGYPGNLSVTVRYRFTDDNELIIDYAAETDKTTVLNLTNHCYFNLTGDVNNKVTDHTIQINASHYTPVNEHQIPTGVIASVAGTPYDFTTAEKIGTRINETDGGYDHNYVIDNPSVKKATAIVTEESSGRKLEVYTDQPGIQFYTGNSLDGSHHTNDGQAITRQSAFCLETQHFPDSPNQPSFPSTLLHPGEKYHTITKYRLTTAQR